MRELSRSTLKDVPSEEKESTFHGNNNLAESKSSASIKYADAKGEMTYASGKSKKPAWALSETNAEALHEAKLQSEEDDLLNFVDNLNYDQTIADIEIKVMTEKIRKRIEELEKDVEVEETRDADAEMRAMKREMLELMVSLLKIHSSVRKLLMHMFYVDDRVKQNNRLKIITPINRMKTRQQ